MLLLLFEPIDGRYALHSKYIVEIIPLLKTKKIPAAPAFVRGMINYHGTPVPVFDFSAIEGGEASRVRFRTLIILVNYPLDDDEKLVGLIAEKATDVIRCEESDIRATGILLEKDTITGTGDSAQEELVQLFDIKRMIPEDVLRELY